MRATTSILSCRLKTSRAPNSLATRFTAKLVSAHNGIEKASEMSAPGEQICAPARRKVRARAPARRRLALCAKWLASAVAQIDFSLNKFNNIIICVVAIVATTIDSARYGSTLTLSTRLDKTWSDGDRTSWASQAQRIARFTSAAATAAVAAAIVFERERGEIERAKWVHKQHERLCELAQHLQS